MKKLSLKLKSHVEHITLVKECYLNNDQEETEVETNTSLNEETEEFVTEDVIQKVLRVMFKWHPK